MKPPTENLNPLVEARIRLLAWRLPAAQMGAFRRDEGLSGGLMRVG